VVLRDLQLKREALDKFDLPVDVLEGHLGELTLSIPWSNLRNKPVKVYINNVYLLAVPRNELNVSTLGSIANGWLKIYAYGD
jgi:vacuolar protein sorting-associated protein 13A/C